MTLTMTTAQDDEPSVSNQSYGITLNLSIIFYLLIKTAYYVIAAIAPRCNYTKKSEVTPLNSTTRTNERG